MREEANGRRPSIRDVARLAGVSHQTVSRVLNDHPSIRPETRDRVLTVMQEISYVPNIAARALVTSRSKTIGILVDQSAQYGRATSIAAIEEAARERGYWVSTANIHARDRGSIPAGVAHLMAQAIEGLVVVAPEASVLRILQEQSISIPYVTMQATEVDPGHTLSINQIAGARMATRHLIERGHREIHHLAGPQDWIEAEARMQGYLDEMDAAELNPYAPILGDWTADFGYYATHQLIRTGGVTAIFSSNDQMALGALHAMRDLGVDCPGQVSLVGFDDIPEAQHFWPPLTTVRQDFAEIGRRCVDLLLGAADGSDAIPVIMPELVIRESTGPVRRS